MSDTVDRSREEDEPRNEQGRDHKVSLAIEGVTKEFTEDDGSTVVAVDDMTLDIYDSEFIVFVGPSGCGKTTTLRTVAGLERPTRGEIRIDGDSVAGREPRERDVAMVFQNYALYPHKTVRENIAFPLVIRKFPDDVVEERVAETVELLGIGELLDRYPSDLSGGQQQRVALGRAIIRDPEVFLFDEPLSNLDAKLRIEMRTELNKLHDRVGKTSVYVTHDQAEAMTLADRVVVMNDGRIQQVDVPEVVYERPANRFVAGFIGEPPMNFFDAEIDHAEDGLRVRTDAFELVLSPSVAETIAERDGADIVEVGVRPEAFEAVAHVDTAVDESRLVEAHVTVIEPMGSHHDLTLRPVGAEDDESAEYTARVSKDTDAVEGERIRLAVDTEEVHLFDATGENVLA